MARRAKTLRSFQLRRFAVARGDDQHRNPKSDIEIAQAAAMRPIGQVAADKLGIPDEALSLYGRYKAKISLDYIRSLADRPNGRLILVTAITPTPAGEGKTTTTVGLGDALNHIGKKAILCLREPSLGPCFGVKGGAAGGGYAQVVPMEDINLHFTGDLHAIGAANNLLAALVDNHIHYGLEPRIDPRRVAWRRGLDMNDRALRSIVASLGAEKFFDIKCRKAGLKPDAAVIVATVRALKMHGGVARDGLKEENVAALEKGFANLQRHLENLRGFGVPTVVSVNRFSADTEAELGRLKELCAKEGVEAVVADHWARGGEGAADLARAVVKLADSGKAEFKLLYHDEMPLRDKIKTIAQKIYRAKDVACDGAVETRLAELQKGGFGNFPVCIAKTQYSFTTDPNAKGAPTDHVLGVREIRLSAGAEFVVAVCGEIMTMPGLPRVPAANNIDLSVVGRVTGLFCS